MRNRLLLVLVAAAVLTGGCEEATSVPSSVPTVFTAVLSPANEVPPVGNAEASGRGGTQIHFDRPSAGGNATATVYFQLSGFPAATRLAGAHIHVAPAGVNGPIVVDTGIVAASGVVTENGQLEYTARGIPVSAAVMDAIVANPSGYYFNVHSPMNPGGFARGQLQRIQ